MSNDLDEFDYAAAIATPSRRAGLTLEGRRATEKMRLSEADRRLVRTTGRTAQLNLKVRPMTKVEFGQVAAKEKIMTCELFERAFDLYKSVNGA